MYESLWLSCKLQQLKNFGGKRINLFVFVYCIQGPVMYLINQPTSLFGFNDAVWFLWVEWYTLWFVFHCTGEHIYCLHDILFTWYIVYTIYCLGYMVKNGQRKQADKVVFRQIVIELFEDTLFIPVPIASLAGASVECSICKSSPCTYPICTRVLGKTEQYYENIRRIWRT